MYKYQTIVDSIWTEFNIKANKPRVVELSEPSEKDTWLGCLESELSDQWENHYLAKNIISYKSCIIIPIEIRLLLNYKDERLSDDIVIFTLMHEIAHAITLAIYKKCNKKWVSEDHGREFYSNFSRIVDYMKKSGIYKVSYTRGGSLKRVDDIVSFSNQDIKPGKYLE